MSDIVKRLRHLGGSLGEVASTQSSPKEKGRAAADVASEVLTAADIIASLRQRVEMLGGALALVMPMAKGYAADHPVGSNAEYVRDAESVLATVALTSEAMGRLAYERDLNREPYFIDAGRLRPTWDKLDAVEKLYWERPYRPQIAKANGE